MRQIGFLQVTPRLGVVARALLADQAVRLGHRHAQIDDEILGRQRVNFVFELLQPRQKFGALLARHARALVRQIRCDVAVGKHHFARRERGLDRGLRFQPVAGVEQRGKVRVHGGERAKFAIQKLRHELAEKAGIVGKADLRERHSPAAEFPGERFELRAFPGAVDSFEHDEFAAGRHGSDGQSSSRKRLVTSGSCPHARIAAMPDQTNAIAANLARVRERMARAAERAGRRADEVTLVAVSKTFPAEAIRAAYDAGLREFGENRVQEFESKRPKLADLDATWHLIGHLQSNKARRAVQLFDRVDSVDSLALAQKLDSAAAEYRQTPAGTDRSASRRRGDEERCRRGGIIGACRRSFNARRISNCAACSRFLRIQTTQSAPALTFGSCASLRDSLSRRLGRPVAAHFRWA